MSTEKRRHSAHDAACFLGQCNKKGSRTLSEASRTRRVRSRRVRDAGRLCTSFDSVPIEKHRHYAHDAADFGCGTSQRSEPHPERSFKNSASAKSKGARCGPALYIVRLHVDGETSTLRSRCDLDRELRTRKKGNRILSGALRTFDAAESKDATCSSRYLLFPCSLLSSSFFAVDFASSCISPKSPRMSASFFARVQPLI